MESAASRGFLQRSDVNCTLFLLATLALGVWYFDRTLYGLSESKFWGLKLGFGLSGF